MSNPLTSSTNSQVNSFQGMVPGETRTITFRDGRTKTITRTSRRFIEDWIDSTNAEIPPSRGLKWVLDGSGQPILISAKHAEHLSRQKGEKA